MNNHFCKYPLWEVSQTLAAVAQGREPAELVITHARLVNVCTHEILEDCSVAVARDASPLWETQAIVSARIPKWWTPRDSTLRRAF